MSEKGNVNKSTPIYGGLTPGEIENLKRKSKTTELSLITVIPKSESGEAAADVLFFWFKKIDMTVFSAASKFVETDPVKATQVIIENTLVKGDKEATNDVDVFAALSPKLLGSIGTASATLKKF